MHWGSVRVYFAVKAGGTLSSTYKFYLAVFPSPVWLSGAGQGVSGGQGEGEEAAGRSGSRGRSPPAAGAAQHGAEDQTRPSRQRAAPAEGKQSPVSVKQAFNRGRNNTILITNRNQ